MKIWKKLRWFDLCRKNEISNQEKQIFKNLVECAECIFKKTKEERGVDPDNFSISLDEHRCQCFLELIRAILRPLQSELLLKALEEGELTFEKFPNEKKPINNLFEPDIMSFIREQKSKYELKLDVFKHELYLCKDVIFALPWNRCSYDRYITAICLYRSNKKFKWEQQPDHDVELWLPWHIAFVEDSGNHSIAAGILNATSASLKPTRIYDMSPILDLIGVDKDGEYYHNKGTNEIIAKVESGRNAAVFEIGRYIKECNKKQRSF
ncbi:DUF6710 family protein [Helicobacter suis]|uniref:DUF6710 family protein n=1 Tax=Helicobacter suis TaxID=104628 RepID=UPI0013D70B22|nr:DUF6710 family protein [Helicobacter suis]